MERIRGGLRSLGVAVEHEVEKGRLVLESKQDYLDNGRFNPDRMLGFLQQGYEATLAEGFTGLRAAGDVAWQVGAEKNFDEIVYYESLLDVFFLGKRMVGMCQYHRGSCPPEVLTGILNTHKIAAIDANVCSNFHYVPPELLLEKQPEVRHHKRVEWMTSQLLRAKNAEEKNHRLNAELEGRVAARTAELQAAYEDMESFSYSVSHDLRAPLRAIDGFSASLAETQTERLDLEGRQDLNRIREGARRMSVLIDDLLHFSKVSRQGISLTRVEMTSLARSVAEEVSASLVAFDSLPAALGDRSLLRQVLVNLLSNAVKFTRHRESPKIEIGARREGGQIEFFVKDNGAGFDMEHTQRLFGVFQRLHRQDEFEGTGIGLAIVKRIVERHGGQVRAEGRAGVGATIFFTLQAAPTAEA